MSDDSYSATLKFLHWLIALLILVQFPLGWGMGEFTGVRKIQAFNFHKSLGLTILALMLLRMFWRLLHPAPSLLAAMPKGERVAAHSVQGALYLTVFLVTLAGWAMISVSKFPSSFYEIAIIPRLPWLGDLPEAGREAYKAVFGEAHELLGLILLALVAAHLAGALRHAIRRDGIFSTMLPRFGGRSRGAPLAIFLFVSLLGGVGAMQKARASEWSVAPEKSQIAFEATGGGYTTQGAFGRYRAEIEFDPDEPAQASVNVLLDMNSAATGTADADQTLKSADFFDTSRFPAARFTARGAQPEGDGKYVLNGHLTLKGVTKPVSLPFSIRVDSGTATVNAEAKINRLDFGVGPESVAGLPLDKDVKLTIGLTAVRLDN